MRQRDKERLLPGAANPEAYAPCESPNLAEIGASVARYRAGLNRLAHRLVVADRLVSIADAILRLSQPPKDRKFGFAWWLANGQSAMRRPFLVRWMRRINGRWRARVVGKFMESMVDRKGTSAVAADLTLEMVTLGRELVASRNRVLESYRRIGVALMRAEQYWVTAQVEHERKLRELHGALVERLKGAGYAVTPNALALFALFDAEGGVRSLDADDVVMTAEELREHEKRYAPVGAVHGELYDEKPLGPELSTDREEEAEAPADRPVDPDAPAWPRIIGYSEDGTPLTDEV